MEMQFPDWVEKPGRQSKTLLAAKRLKFLIYQATLKHDGEITMPAFSKKIGYDRSAVHRAIAGGSFGKKMAIAAEEAYGAELLPAQWLINPLEIPTK